MSDRIEELFQKVTNEICKDPLRRFAELVAADEREANKREWVSLTDEEIENLELPNKPTVKEFVQFIEAALRSKNNG